MPDRHLKERTKEKKEAMIANFSFYNGYFGDNFWPKKYCLTEDVHLAVTFPKIERDIIM